LARKTCAPGVSYGLHIGMTSDPHQIEEAVDCYNEFSLRKDGRIGVVGFKMFAGKSIGDLEIIDEGEQRIVYSTLGNLGYEGVLNVHCEKENLMRPKLWNPNNPISHSFVRPAISELKSVQDQVGFFYDTGFNGRLHIAHVSNPATVDYINDVKINDVKSMKISCGATPHALFLNYNILKGDGDEFVKRGLLLKFNPPLRSKNMQVGLLKKLKEGEIDTIETDHANHEFEFKMNHPFLSGVPGITSWTRVIERLRKENISEENIKKLVYENVLNIYDLPESVVGNCKVNKGLKFDDYKYGCGDFI
jgi:dihydroorotase